MYFSFISQITNTYLIIPAFLFLKSILKLRIDCTADSVIAFWVYFLHLDTEQSKVARFSLEWTQVTGEGS